jgi:hypothetical protein
VLRFAIALLLSLVAGAPASAQTAEQLLEDLARFRGALGASRHLNAVFESADSEVLRVATGPTSIELLDGAGNQTEVHAAASDASLPLRLLAAVLSTADLAEVLAESGFSVGEQLLSFEVFEGLDGSLLARRVGTANASVLLEPGTSRLRQLRVLHEGVAWQIDVLRYDGPGAGWLPSEMIVRADTQTRLVVRVLDAARDAASLAPLDAAAGRRPPPPLRFPRLPL